MGKPPENPDSFKMPLVLSEFFLMYFGSVEMGVKNPLLSRNLEHSGGRLRWILLMFVD